MESGVQMERRLARNGNPSPVDTFMSAGLEPNIHMLIQERDNSRRPVCRMLYRVYGGCSRDGFTYPTTKEAIEIKIFLDYALLDTLIMSPCYISKVKKGAKLTCDAKNYNN
ncbi:hypothetical protein O3G_MSEX012971 [Manduca sexta]|uniref:Uncharacterized protein n=1 Tax=Manduca sexta TaxID=7130 RepID=A0A921ZPX3_MANSE|nr:hypothetical protein O3G_MSEX012971 [Manduca sexta]